MPVLIRNGSQKRLTVPGVKVPVAPEKSAIYFVDVPGAKQSVIYIGAPSIPRTNPDYYPAYVANYKLGGSFNGIFNLILREEKGFTYGARSNISRIEGIWYIYSIINGTDKLNS